MQEKDRSAETVARSPLTRDLGSAAHNKDTSVEDYLTDCERLKPKVYCDTLYLSQVFPLVRRKSPTCSYSPVTLPTRELGKLCQVIRDRKGLHHRLIAFSAARDKGVREAGVPFAVLETEISRFVRQRDTGPRKSRKRSTRPATDAEAPERTSLALDSKELAAIRERATKRTEKLGGSQALLLSSTPPLLVKPRPPRRVHTGGLSLLDRYRRLIADLPIPQPEEAKPSLGFEVLYSQEWCSKGYRRGRLVRSIPLTADGRKEIAIKSWTIRKERREANESVENDISTEIVGDEKWSHATTKQLSAELNQTVDANVKASGEVPVEGVTVGVEGGAGSTTSGTVAGSITDTVERVHQATIKSTDSLKKKVSSSVETSEETGFETTVTETIVNPNKCNTLTYHFFEVTETYEITTGVHSISPVLLVALPSPTITAQWLLCHECLLKKYLPCESFYAGFEAAKTITSRELLGEFLGSLDSPEVQQASAATLDAVEAALAAYLALSNATIALTPVEAGGGNPLEEAWNDFQDGLGEIADQASDFAEDVGEFVDGVVDASVEIVEEIGKALEAIGNVFFPQAQMASGATMAFSVAHTPGGVGSYIYWRVAEIAAPELGAALAGLEAAHERIAAMPEGPAKVNALAGALRAFFTTLGDVDEVFNKIQTGLSVVAAGLAATSFAGAAAVVGLIAVTGVVTIPIALAILGAAGVLALGELVALVAGLLAGDEGIDIVPDDEGLKAAIGALAGLQQQLGQAADLPAPPQSNDPADTAAYQQELQEAKRRRRELAEAQVELDRLVCHIRENRSHYTQLYWSAVPSADLQRILQTDFDIPAHFVEPKIVGFSGVYAAFRVANVRWLKTSGIDVEAAMKELESSGLLQRARKSIDVTMPTRGMTVEPELGSCDACDDFVHFHREQDKLLKTEEVEQTKLETRRLQERLDRGLLGDPTPFERAASVSVSTSAPEDVATPPSDASDAGDGDGK